MIDKKLKMILMYVMTENNKIIEISYYVTETKINKHENNYLIKVLDKSGK